MDETSRFSKIQPREKDETMDGVCVCKTETRNKQKQGDI